MKKFIALRVNKLGTISTFDETATFISNSTKAGQLTISPAADDTKKIFSKYVNPSFDGFKSKLWSFEFLLNREVLLQISDYSICTICLTD